MPESLTQFLPKWVRSHPRVVVFGSVAGPLIMLAAVWVEFFSTDVGTGILLLLGFMLLIATTIGHDTHNGVRLSCSVGRHWKQKRNSNQKYLDIPPDDAVLSGSSAQRA